MGNTGEFKAVMEVISLCERTFVLKDLIQDIGLVFGGSGGCLTFGTVRCSANFISRV